MSKLTEATGTSLLGEDIVSIPLTAHDPTMGIASTLKGSWSKGSAFCYCPAISALKVVASAIASYAPLQEVLVLSWVSNSWNS